MRASVWLACCLAVYVPHLTEEYLTRMYDDPLIVSAFQPLESLASRQASYLVFQVMLTASLVMTSLVSRGGRGQAAVLGSLAVALLCESHHLIRALVTLHYNPGLATALPMPLLGAALLATLLRRSPAFAAEERNTTCFTK